MRHIPTKKVRQNKETQITLGLSGQASFSAGRRYSLIGCSPAEPISAYNGSYKFKTYHNK